MIVHIVFVFQRVSISIGVVARAFALLHHGDRFHGIWRVHEVVPAAKEWQIIMRR
jgi:hypothetical protein